MPPRVRRLSEEDLDHIVALCREHAAYERTEYEDNGQRDRLRRAFFDVPPALFGWVVDDDRQIHGYMTATIDYATWTAARFVYMDCLYLKESSRGRGLGRALMDALLAFAREQGIDEIQWQTPPDNELGIRFYQRIGAKGKPKQRYTLPVR